MRRVICCPLEFFSTKWNYPAESAQASVFESLKVRVIWRISGTGETWLVVEGTAIMKCKWGRKKKYWAHLHRGRLPWPFWVRHQWGAQQWISRVLWWSNLWIDIEMKGRVTSDYSTVEATWNSVAIFSHAIWRFFFEKLCYHGAEGKMSGRRIGGTVVAAGTKPRDTFVSLRFCPMLTTACGKDLVAVQCRYEWTVW